MPWAQRERHRQGLAPPEADIPAERRGPTETGGRSGARVLAPQRGRQSVRKSQSPRDSGQKSWEVRTGQRRGLGPAAPLPAATPRPHPPLPALPWGERGVGGEG